MDIDYVPEALGAIQDVHVTLTSLLVAEADIVGLIEQLDLVLRIKWTFCSRTDIRSGLEIIGAHHEVVAWNKISIRSQENCRHMCIVRICSIRL